MEILPYNPATEPLAEMSLKRATQICPEAFNRDYDATARYVSPMRTHYKPESIDYADDYHVETNYKTDTGEFHAVHRVLGMFGDYLQQHPGKDMVLDMYQANPYKLSEAQRFGFAYTRYLYDASIDFVVAYPNLFPIYNEMMRRSGANGMMTLADAGTAYFREYLDEPVALVNPDALSHVIEKISYHFLHKGRYVARDKQGTDKYQTEMICLGRSVARQGIHDSTQMATTIGEGVIADKYEVCSNYSETHMVHLLAQIGDWVGSAQDTSINGLRIVVTSGLSNEAAMAVELLKKPDALREYAKNRYRVFGWNVSGAYTSELIHQSSIARYAD